MVLDSSKLFFPYILPTGTNQACNIYGATCQPGSITVSSVASDCHASMVTVPCSSYLASQSTFLATAYWGQTDQVVAKPWLTSWRAGFGRSPECHSFQDILQKAGNGGRWTFSECMGDESVGSATMSGAVPPQVPPFVENQAYFQEWECCGSCYLDTPDVRLYYFEENDGPRCRSNLSATAGPSAALNSNTSQELQSVARRVVSVPPSGSLAVVDGQTLWVSILSLSYSGEANVHQHFSFCVSRI